MKEKTLKDLLSSLKIAGKPKTSAYDTQATVTRIEDGTAWVHIPGGVTETPVKLTISAKAGDVVQVRVSGGRAFMVGNASAPPTDDTVATGAVRQISTVRKVVEKVREVAETASRIAGNTNQYFWHVQEGTDTGAHITEIPREDFLDDPTNGGGNLLARSNGIAVRDGLTELATFGANGSTIGEANKTHLEMDYRSIKGKDKEGNEFFDIGDLRDANGVAEAEDLFDADGDTNVFTLTFHATSILHVYVLGDETDNYTFDDANNTVTVSTSVAQSGDPVEIFYLTDTIVAKAYTLGIRATSPPSKGFMSVAMGYNNKATAKHSVVMGYNNWADGAQSLALGNDCKTTGQQSLAGGLHSIAEGNRSFAFGLSAYTSGLNSGAVGYNVQAYNNHEFVVGKNNDPTQDSSALFTVGNGTSNSAKSNALVVNATGDAVVKRKVIAGAVQYYTPSNGITWSNGQTPNTYHCVVSAGICSFGYQGAAVAHAVNDQLLTLPAGARPSTTISVPFVKMTGGVVGTIQITDAGVVKVTSISNTTNTGRIYFNCSFPVV